MILTRRALLESLSIAGAACALGPAGLARAGSNAGHELDWDWLSGNWNVYHERLRDRLVGSTTWDKFAGKSNFWHTLGGLGNVDDDLLDLPTGTYRAISVRTFDPATSKWAIWWLDGRTAGKLDPPVIGGFRGDEGEFLGTDVYKGTPVIVRFRWHEVRSPRPWWDQSFSTDNGKTWEVNWRNYFTRTSIVASPVPWSEAPPAADDWKFLRGKWKVRNRRLTQTGVWEEFASTLHNWPVMGGLGNIGDNVFHAPSGDYHGMSVRAFDTQKKTWNTWWTDARNPSVIAPSVAGGFENGVGTLVGDGARSLWTKTDTATPHWEQAVSTDGKNWQTNWVADFERADR
jgi:hypothetical protein